MSRWISSRAIPFSSGSVSDSSISRFSSSSRSTLRNRACASAIGPQLRELPPHPLHLPLVPRDGGIGKEAFELGDFRDQRVRAYPTRPDSVTLSPETRRNEAIATSIWRRSGSRVVSRWNHNPGATTARNRGEPILRADSRSTS